MAAGAISYREIEAYQNTTLSCLRAWDVVLIRRIDTAIRNGPTEAKTDVGGLKTMLRGAIAAKAARDAKPAS